MVSREEIMERLWGNDEFVDDNTLTVNITRIRKKAGSRWSGMISSQQSVGLISGWSIKIQELDDEP